MPSSFGIGASIKILQVLTAPPKIGEYDAMCAFVPVSVAKTELDARNYIIDQMIQAFEATVKDQKHELLKKSDKPEHYNEKANPVSAKLLGRSLAGPTWATKAWVVANRLPINALSASDSRKIPNLSSLLPYRHGLIRISPWPGSSQELSFSRIYKVWNTTSAMKYAISGLPHGQSIFRKTLLCT